MNEEDIEFPGCSNFEEDPDAPWVCKHCGYDDLQHRSALEDDIQKAEAVKQ